MKPAENPHAMVKVPSKNTPGVMELIELRKKHPAIGKMFKFFRFFDDEMNWEWRAYYKYSMEPRAHRRPLFSIIQNIFYLDQWTLWNHRMYRRSNRWLDGEEINDVSLDFLFQHWDQVVRGMFDV